MRPPAKKSIASIANSYDISKQNGMRDLRYQ